MATPLCPICGLPVVHDRHAPYCSLKCRKVAAVERELKRDPNETSDTRFLREIADSMSKVLNERFSSGIDAEVYDGVLQLTAKDAKRVSFLNAQKYSSPDLPSGSRFVRRRLSAGRVTSNVKFRGRNR